MWRLWRKSNLYHKLPSEIFGERDPLAAWMLDNAVTAFGTIVENALQERDEMEVDGQTLRTERYKLSDLLDPEFRLPRPHEEDDFAAFKGVDGIVYDEV
jgi:hypothetical protein